MRRSRADRGSAHAIALACLGAMVLALALGVFLLRAVDGRATLARKIAATPIVSSQTAAQHQGEAVRLHGRAGVAEGGITHRSTKGTLLYYRESPATPGLARQDRVPEFRIGSIWVQPGDTASFVISRPAMYGEQGQLELLRVGQTITVMGVVRDGQIRAGDPFVITDLSPRGLERFYRRSLNALRGLAWLLLALGAFLMVRSAMAVAAAREEATFWRDRLRPTERVLGRAFGRLAAPVSSSLSEPSFVRDCRQRRASSVSLVMTDRRLVARSQGSARPVAYTWDLDQVEHVRVTRESISRFGVQFETVTIGLRGEGRLELQLPPESVTEFLRVFPRRYEILGRMPVRAISAQGFAPDDPNLSLTSLVVKPGEPAASMAVTTEGLVLQWESAATRETRWQMFEWRQIERLEEATATPAWDRVGGQTIALRLRLAEAAGAYVDLALRRDHAAALQALYAQHHAGPPAAATPSGER